MFYPNKVRPSHSGNLKPLRWLISACALFILITASCSDNNPVNPGYQPNPLSSIGNDDAVLNGFDFAIVPKYTYIRSYPGGGGIFVASLVTSESFTGNVFLSLDADPSLNAVLDRKVLNSGANIAEITIKPDISADTCTYEITLRAASSGNPSHFGFDRAVSLEVEVMQWGPGSPTNVIPVLEQFTLWLETVHPELGDFSNRVWFPYMTYPQIWIVEHWTFLDEDWEFRLSNHVMVPPYDWSKIMLRRRGEWAPELAAMRETDGTIHEIPISEYPIMYGY